MTEKFSASPERNITCTRGVRFGTPTIKVLENAKMNRGKQLANLLRVPKVRDRHSRRVRSACGITPPAALPAAFAFELVDVGQHFGDCGVALVSS